MDMLRDMALFVEVAKAMSFKRAADASGTPPSSLSRRISELEKAVGVRLLNRTTRSLELTEAGALYYARCREIVDAARIAHEQLGAVAETPRGRFRVSTTVEFARLFLGPVIADYVRAYPDVPVEFDLQPHKVDLIAQNFDLALRIGPQPDSSLIARRLGSIRTSLYAAPAYLAGAAKIEAPGDLAGHAAILNLNSPMPDVWVLSKDGTTVEVDVTGPVSVNNFGTMRELAVLGVGVTGLHEPMVAGDVRSGRLKRVLPDWTLREAPVYAIMPSRLLPAKTRLFLDMLTERVAPRLETAP